MNKILLIIFVKNPVLGKVKTRLAKTIGDQKALAVYLDLLAHTKSVTENLPIDKAVYYDQEVIKDDLWTQKNYHKKVQYQGDLGERMYHAIADGFAQGYRRVGIIGSDCYQLTSAVLMEGFETLNDKDVVIGPANDGGYYFLAMSTLVKKLFQDKSWSTEQLMDETLDTLNKEKKTYALLPELIDVDNQEDLRASGYLK